MDWNKYTELLLECSREFQKEKSNPDYTSTITKNNLREMLSMIESKAAGEGEELTA